MKKIIIIGCPGSGKSTLSRNLSEILNITVYHLDMFFWTKEKTTVDDETFLKSLNEVLFKDEWIIDGHYGKTLERRIQSCDTIIFLDMSLDVCINNVKQRIGKKRPDMPWVETKDKTHDEFLQYIKSFAETKLPHTYELLNKYKDKNIITFKSYEEINQFLESLKRK